MSRWFNEVYGLKKSMEKPVGTKTDTVTDSKTDPKPVELFENFSREKEPELMPLLRKILGDDGAVAYCRGNMLVALLRGDDTEALIASLLLSSSLTNKDA
jgi:hypothetical protein